jgi:hypothetical protein
VIVKIGGYWDNRDRDTNVNPNIIRLANASRFDSLDILFIGSSALYSGINPAFFDSIHLRTFNLGIAAAGPYFYELMIDDYLHATVHKPKSVFILLSPATFVNDVDDFTSFSVHRYLNQPLTNEQLVQRFGLWKSYIPLLLKSFQKGIQNLVHIGYISTVVKTETIQGRGFYRSDEITSSTKEQSELKASKFKFEKFNTARFYYLREYIKGLKRRGIDIFLFSVPYNKLPAFFNYDYLRDYRKAVLSLAKEYTYLDLSDMRLDSLCYRNSDHLNTHGASIVTRKLITEIKDIQ